MILMFDKPPAVKQQTWIVDAEAHGCGVSAKPPVGISTDFDVKPDAYMVRLVVRDAEERQVTADNAGMRVP